MKRLPSLLVLLLACTLPQSFAATVTSTWLAATSGNWNDGARWDTNPTFPNNAGPTTYDALINAVGPAYTVTLNTSSTVEDLLMSSANATVNHTTGVFTATSTLSISAGIYRLSGGEISNTAINLSGSGSFGFSSSGGTLSNGTVLNGDLNLSDPSAAVRLQTGATFTGVANLSNTFSTLVIQDTQTLTGKTINMDGNSARFAIDGTNSVSLGAGTLVRGRGSLGAAVFTGGTSTLINAGTIRADLAGQTLTVNPSVFTNSAAGVVEAVNGSTLNLGASNWVNNGTINATGSSAVNLTSTFTDPGIVNTSTGGVVNVNGTWNNAGNYNFPGTGSLRLLGGTVNGGQLTPGAGKTLLFTSSGGSLGGGLIFNGDLNLSDPSAAVRLQTGATFTGVANLSNTFSTLVIQDTQTLTGKTINMDGNSARFAIDGTNSVSLGAGTLVRGRGSLGAAVFTGGTSTLINAGTIRADLAGQTLTVNPSVFTNSAAGVVEAVNGSTLNLGASNWVNNGTINATGSSAVNLTSTFTDPGIVNTSTGGVVNVNGTWNNAGNYNFPGTGSLRLLGGTVNGGQLTPGAGKTLLFTSSGGSLGGGLIFNGDLNLSDPSAAVRLQTGATFTGVANLSNTFSTLVIQDTQTLTGKTINMDGNSARFAIDGTNSVSLGAGTLVRGRGSLGAAVFTGGTSTLINAGTIRADLAGQTLTVNPSVFTQQGTLEATNGATLNVPAGYTQTAGTTRVDTGTIQTTFPNAIVIASGSLEGRGTINAPVANSGTISPGLTAGALAISGDLSLTSRSVVRIELGGTTQGTQYDLLSEAGTVPLTLGGELLVTFINGFQSSVQPTDSFTIVSSNAAILGAFSNVVGGRVFTADGAGFFDVTVSGNNVILGNFVVPEPSTALLLVSGVLLFRRKRAA